jgi:hypothetical protein
VRREERHGAKEICVDRPLGRVQRYVETLFDESIRQIPVPRVQLDLRQAHEDPGKCGLVASLACELAHLQHDGARLVESIGTEEEERPVVVGAGENPDAR